MADQSIPMFLRSALATGDLIYRAASSTWQRLGIGSANNLLGITSGLPAWGTLVSWMEAISSTRGALLRRGSSAWEAFTGSQGGVLIRDANDAAWLAAGTAGQFLKTNGAGADPSWASASTGRIVIVKTADRVRDSDGTGSHESTGATMTDDNELYCTLSANTRYSFTLFGPMSASANPDFKCDFNFTGTTTDASKRIWAVLLGTGVVYEEQYDADLTTDASVPSGVSSTYNIGATGHINVGASGGTFSFRWAQLTAHGTNTTLHRGATLIVEPVT